VVALSTYLIRDQVVLGWDVRTRLAIVDMEENVLVSCSGNKAKSRRLFLSTLLSRTPLTHLGDAADMHRVGLLTGYEGYRRLFGWRGVVTRWECEVRRT